MVTFLIERHGESLGNFFQIFLGQTDLDLTDRGYRQARLTAEWLKDRYIDAIFTSPLMRAAFTGDAHAAFHPVPVVRDESLCEMYVGVLEGRLKSKIEEIAPGWIADYFGSGFGTATAEKMETSPEAAARFTSGLRRIAEGRDGQTLLIASHAGILRAFVCSLSGEDPARWGDLFPFAENASVTTVTLDEAGFHLISYSETPPVGYEKTDAFVRV